MLSQEKLFCLFVCSSLLMAACASENPQNSKQSRPLMLDKISELGDKKFFSRKRQPNSKVKGFTNNFSLAMKKHSEKHKAGTTFVSNMFKLFDLDGSRDINKREFRLVFQLLRIVEHNL